MSVTKAIEAIDKFGAADTSITDLSARLVCAEGHLRAADQPRAADALSSLRSYVNDTKRIDVARGDIRHVAYSKHVPTDIRRALLAAANKVTCR